VRTGGGEGISIGGQANVMVVLRWI